MLPQGNGGKERVNDKQNAEIRQILQNVSHNFSVIYCVKMLIKVNQFIQYFFVYICAFFSSNIKALHQKQQKLWELTTTSNSNYVQFW